MNTDPFTEAARARIDAEADAKRLVGKAMRDAWTDHGEYALLPEALAPRIVEWARAHLAAQEPTNAGPHELDEDAPVLNLGYYRSSARCKCGHEVIWGEHDGDAGLDEAWRVHLMRSDVHAFRAARRDEAQQ